jgi:hypothetical protein
MQCDKSAAARPFQTNRADQSKVVVIQIKNNVANIPNNTDAHSFSPRTLTPMRPRCARYRAENVSPEDYAFMTLERYRTIFWWMKLAGRSALVV